MGYDKDRRTLKSLCASLILFEKIVTTPRYARHARSLTEKYITKAKKNDLHAKKQLFALLPQNAARKTFEVLGAKYADRKGGYVRVSKVGKSKDGNYKVQLQLI